MEHPRKHSVPWSTTYPKADVLGSNLLQRVSGNLLLSVNRVRVRWSSRFSLRSRNDDTIGEEDGVTLLHKISTSSLKVDRRLLCSTLSSMPPLSPATVCKALPAITKTKLLDLPNQLIINILSLLKGKDLVSAMGVCKKFRRFVLRTVSREAERNVAQKTFQVIKISTFEINVVVNRETHRTDVLLQRIRRSIAAEGYSCIGYSLADVMSGNPLLVFYGKVYFGNDVNFCEWRGELQRLFHTGRLIPNCIIFGGGDCRKMNRTSGVDLRSFTEGEFIAYISQFVPHLKSVQLLTSRHFKMSTSPPRLLSLISLLSEFGYAYERPALKFEVTDLIRIVQHWRHDPLSHSCRLGLRRPRGISLLAQCLPPAREVGENSQLKRIEYKHTTDRFAKLELVFT